MPEKSDSFSFDGFYPASVLRDKSFLDFAPLPKPESAPLFGTAYFLKIYDSDGRREGAFLLHGLHTERPLIMYSKMSSDPNDHATPAALNWPAPILKEDAQFLTISGTGGKVFRIKKNDALAVGFVQISLGKFLDACRKNPELLNGVAGAALKAQAAESAFPYKEFLRREPNDTAPFVAMDSLPEGAGQPQMKLLSRIDADWFQIELHFRYKYTADPEKGVGTAVYDKTFRGYWHVPYNAHGFPSLLLHLPNSENSKRTLLDLARAADVEEKIEAQLVESIKEKTGDDLVARESYSYERGGPRWTGLRKAIEFAHSDPEVRWGYINHAGEFIIEPIYTEARSFSDGLALVRHEKENLSGYIKSNGELAVPTAMGIGDFHEGYARVAIAAPPRYKESFIGRDGRIMELPEVSMLRDFANSVAMVMVDSPKSGGELHWEYLCADGRFCEFASGNPPLRQMTNFSREGLAAVCDSTGSLRFPPGGNGIAPEEARKQMYEWKKHWRIIDTAGVTVGNLKGKAVDFFDYNPDWPGVFHDGLAFVQYDYAEDGTANAYIDKTGEEVIASPDGCEFRFDGFRAQRAVVKTKGYGKNVRYGFIDTKGRVVVPMQYEGAFLFREGLAAVCRDGWWGFIDAANNEVIRPSFNVFYPSISTASCDFDSPSFYEDLALVERRDGRLCYIDKTGVVRIELPENTVAALPFHEGRAAVAVLVPTGQRRTLGETEVEQ